jgi:TIR domain
VTDRTKAVLISYASDAAEAARRICDALLRAGIEVWFDKSELRGGDAWDQSIRRQIKNCALFIPVVSRHTHEIAEGYFRLEWKLAVDRSHLMTETKAFLLPVAIDDTPEDDDQVPDRFRELQWARLPGGDTPTAFGAGRGFRGQVRLTLGGVATPLALSRATITAPQFESIMCSCHFGRRRIKRAAVGWTAPKHCASLTVTSCCVTPVWAAVRGKQRSESPVRQ